MASARGRRPASLWADAGMGLVSGLIIPAPVIVVLDLGLLLLGLWGVFSDASRVGAPGDGSIWALLMITVAVNLQNILRHLWAIRWAFLVTGGLGAVAALAQRAASHIPRGWGRGLSFMTIFAAMSLTLDSFLLIGREGQAHLMAIDRAIYFLRQLRGESYDTDLVTGTTIALGLGLLFWELWRSLYSAVRAQAGLPPGRLAALHYQPHTAGVQQMVSGGAGEFDLRGAAQVAGLLLTCFVGWLPLDSAYARYVPRTTSGSVYLEPSEAEQTERVVFGVSPHEIVFASSVGHGLFDAELVKRPGAPAAIREVRDIRLRETPEGSHRYTHMSVEGLEAGEYYLRMSLRPAGELPPDAFAIMGDGEGVVNFSLFQGGGISYWLTAVGMAFVLTVGLLGVLALLLQGMTYLRAR
jgi:hypothetical protein